jgi:hypothetical protein
LRGLSSAGLLIVLGRQDGEIVKELLHLPVAAPDGPDLGKGNRLPERRSWHGSPVSRWRVRPFLSRRGVNEKHRISFS